MKPWVLVLVLAAGCRGSKSTESSQQNTQAPGAYEGSDAQSADAKQQAAKAIELLRTAKNDPSIALSAVRSFSKQVVAGMNYKLSLEITSSSGPHAVDVVMFVGLDQHAELTQVTGM